jgi:hypothetical protein
MKDSQTSAKNIWVFIGNMGSGKSEISINFAIHRKKEHPQRPVKLIDLDIIKPYIRLRDREKEITNQGIDLLLPDKSVRNMDMPIVPSHIYDFLRTDSYDLIMDVGGEENGCTTIAQFQEVLYASNLEVYLVINTLRPFSNTVDRIKHTLRSLEAHSHLKVTGLISNTHLRFQTDDESILEGIQKVEQVSKDTSIPIVWTTIWHEIITDQLQQKIPYPILPIKLFLTFPWEKTSSEGL